MAARWTSHAALALVQFNYGIYHVVTKLALDEGANQVVLCVVRDLVALAILGPMAFVAERGKRPPLSRGILCCFFILGLTGIFGNQLLFLLGLNLTSPSASAAVQPGIPVFTFVLALAMGAESLNWTRLDGKVKTGGVLLSILGGIVLAVYKGPNIVHGHDTVTSTMAYFDKWKLGILCLVGNCFCMALYISFQAKVLAKYPAGLTVTAFSYLFGAAVISVTGLLTVQQSSEWILSRAEGLAALYAGVIASALNYTLITWANGMLGPSLVALYMPLQILATSTFSCIFLQSSLQLGTILGGCTIVAGLYCVTWGKNEADKYSQQPLLGR